MRRKSAPVHARSRMTIAEVCEDLGISRSTFYEWRTKGRAPRCIKLPNGVTSELTTPTMNAGSAP
jgi:predicted DNA-binding transcriptional regulator AlpA